MKVSARNMIKGKVKEVKKGAVNSIVILELSGGDEIVSVINKRITISNILPQIIFGPCYLHSSSGTTKIYCIFKLI